MPWGHIGQLTEDGIALLPIEGQRLEAGGLEVDAGDAAGLGCLLQGGQQAGASAILADGLVDPEPLDAASST